MHKPFTVTYMGKSKRKNLALYRLEDEIQYTVNEPNSIYHDYYINVPIGFITDGATIPRILWYILPPMGVYSKAAIIHDYLIDSIAEDKLMDRTKARIIFSLALKELGVNIISRSVLVSGVFIFDQCRKVFKKKQ